jgi:hypothetical protein
LHLYSSREERKRINFQKKIIFIYHPTPSFNPPPPPQRAREKKMHELLLFGQIRPTQYSQVLSILAGIAAMQPQPILERHLVFKPTRPPGSPRSGPVESSILGMPDAQLQAFYAQTKGDTYYVHLVADLNPAETTNNINYNTTNHKEENDKPKEEEKRGENNSMQVDVDVDVDLKIKQEGGGDDDRGDVVGSILSFSDLFLCLYYHVGNFEFGNLVF